MNKCPEGKLVQIYFVSASVVRPFRSELKVGDPKVQDDVAFLYQRRYTQLKIFQGQSLQRIHENEKAPFSIGIF